MVLGTLGNWRFEKYETLVVTIYEVIVFSKSLARKKPQCWFYNLQNKDYEQCKQKKFQNNEDAIKIIFYITKQVKKSLYKVGWMWVYVYMLWGEIEIHEKLSSLNDGRLLGLTFLLVVNSPNFGCCAAVKLSQAAASWESKEWDKWAKRSCFHRCEVS